MVRGGLSYVKPIKVKSMENYINNTPNIILDKNLKGVAKTHGYID